MVFDVSATVLLGLLSWKLTQLVEVQKQIHTELLTARWHTQQRMKALERQVESQG